MNYGYVRSHIITEIDKALYWLGKEVYAGCDIEEFANDITDERTFKLVDINVDDEISPFVIAGRNKVIGSYGFIIPVMSYEDRQKRWTRTHKIKIGDQVTVDPHTPYETDFIKVWDSISDLTMFTKYEVLSIGNNGVTIKAYKNKRLVPFYAIDIVKNVNSNAFDFKDESVKNYLFTKMFTRIGSNAIYTCEHISDHFIKLKMVGSNHSYILTPQTLLKNMEIVEVVKRVPCERKEN